MKIYIFTNQKLHKIYNNRKVEDRRKDSVTLHSVEYYFQINDENIKKIQSEIHFNALR